MSTINTNIPSLVSQRGLRRSQLDLGDSLQRLSTGLKINRGADDPAGLIVSERLRSEIDARLAAGQDLTFPIAVREPGLLKVRFFFGDDFEIVAVPQDRYPKVSYLLVAERGTPSYPRGKRGP